MISVLTCIPSDDGQLSLIREISRVLRPGAILCLGDYLLQEDERNLQRYKEFEPVYGKYGIFRLPEGAVLRHHDKKWIATLTAGFETVDMSEVDITTMNGNPAKAFLYFGRKLLANK
jgi:predicted phosphodiesterase